MNGIETPAARCRIRRARAGLVVVDIQERFAPVIHDWPRLIQNTLRLIRGVRILKLPILCTEQHPKGLGGTVPEIAAELSDPSTLHKNEFDCCAATGFLEALRARGIEDVILCGIEAHVCVCQTALGLLEAGLRPFVVADAVSSRTPENVRYGLERARDAGAVVVSTEMILFELLQRAGSDEFKQILALVK
ncbi:MAG: hydrolase [Verrucomicrobiae bacterium]|nr:hydrolase [Verrucomicrobiae bacterium]